MPDEVVVTPEEKLLATEAKAAETKLAEEKSATDAKAADEAKKVEDAKKVEEKKTPVPYELKLPEGSKLSKTEVDNIAAFAKEQGLSQEQAQKQIERESKLAEGHDAKNIAQLDEATVEWLETAKTDKEIGGEAFPKHAELAKRVISRFGTEEFKDELNRTGLGNHPELVRIFVRIGKSMSEDQFVHPGTKTEQPKDLAEKFYGASKKE